MVSPMRTAGFLSGTQIASDRPAGQRDEGAGLKLGPERWGLSRQGKPTLQLGPRGSAHIGVRFARVWEQMARSRVLSWSLPSSLFWDHHLSTLYGSGRTRTLPSSRSDWQTDRQGNGSNLEIKCCGRGVHLPQPCVSRKAAWRRG